MFKKLNKHVKLAKVKKLDGSERALAETNLIFDNIFEEISHVVKINEALAMPKKNESQDDFISRFMGDEQSKKDFPEHKQRVAVAFTQWRRKDDKTIKEEEQTMEYQDKFKALMAEYKIENLKDLPDEKKSEFFEKADKMHISKKEMGLEEAVGINELPYGEVNSDMPSETLKIKIGNNDLYSEKNHKGSVDLRPVMVESIISEKPSEIDELIQIIEADKSSNNTDILTENFIQDLKKAFKKHQSEINAKEVNKIKSEVTPNAIINNLTQKEKIDALKLAELFVGVVGGVLMSIFLPIGIFRIPLGSYKYTEVDLIKREKLLNISKSSPEVMNVAKKIEQELNKNKPNADKLKELKKEFSSVLKNALKEEKKNKEIVLKTAS